MKDIRSRILWSSAKRLIKKSNPYVIAVGGAIAKTSTKHALSDVLNAGFPGQVHQGYGNLNTYIGVPLSILGFKIDFHHDNVRYKWPLILVQAIVKSYTSRLPKYLILEYGTDQTGDLPALVGELVPNMAILTVVGPAHLANYESERAIALEEGSLVEAVPENGVVLLNRKDPYYDLHLSRTKAKTVLEVDCPLESLSVEIARTVGKHFGVEAAKIERALESKSQPVGRFDRRQVGKHILLDDTYNANPLSMEAALSILKSLPNRRVAILGTMLELGSNEKEMHRQVGLLAKRSADYIVGVGEHSEQYDPDRWFATSDEAAKELFSYLKEDDSILVKGSRGVQMEKITNELLKKCPPQK